MTTLFHALALVLYLAVGALYGASLARARTEVPKFGIALIAAAVLAHTVALITFTTTYHELPLVGLAASLSTFAFLVGACLLAAALATESRPLGVVLAPISALLLIAVLALGVAPAGEPMEFGGVWFAAHVLLAFIGISGLAVAFASSLLYLLQFRELKSKRFGRIFKFSPSLELLDTVAHRALLTGFATLTIALALGWAWTVQFKNSLELSNPKVLWASFTWIVFAVALISRTGGAGVERRSARVNIAAFSVVVLAYVVLRVVVARHGVFL